MVNYGYNRVNCLYVEQSKLLWPRYLNKVLRKEVEKKHECIRIDCMWGRDLPGDLES